MVFFEIDQMYWFTTVTRIMLPQLNISIKYGTNLSGVPTFQLFMIIIIIVYITWCSQGS